MKKINITISALTGVRQQVLIEKVDRRTAELCVGGLFNVLGGIDAKFTIANHVDTSFNYTVCAVKKLNLQTEQRAIAFCKGVQYGRS